MSGGQVLVMAKAPVPGRVKTRLCPPCTPEQAAAVAEAALADTLGVVGASPVGRRVLVVDGSYDAPSGWDVVPQRGESLGVRLAGAFFDTYRPGAATVLVGMDTPQLSASDLADAFRLLESPSGPEAVLGTAVDGGWWALGLRDARHAAVLADIPTSTATTGIDTRKALLGLGLRVGTLRPLTDVDSAADAFAVAAVCAPGSRFPAAVAEHVPPGGPGGWPPDGPPTAAALVPAREGRR